VKDVKRKCRKVIMSVENGSEVGDGVEVRVVLTILHKRERGDIVEA
jgi:hypothetical protein